MYKYLTPPFFCRHTRAGVAPRVFARGCSAVPSPEQPAGGGRSARACTPALKHRPEPGLARRQHDFKSNPRAGCSLPDGRAGCSSSAPPVYGPGAVSCGTLGAGHTDAGKQPFLEVGDGRGRRADSYTRGHGPSGCAGRAGPSFDPLRESAR